MVKFVMLSSTKSIFFAVSASGFAGIIFSWYQAAISAQQATNTAMEVEIKKLEGQIKDIVGLEAEIAALRARQQAVEDGLVCYFLDCVVD